MTEWLKAKIFPPIPDAVYENRVYTQTAVLELPDGKILYAFDHRMLVKQPMIGSVREVVLLCFLSEIDRLDEPAFGIIPNPEYDNWRSHTFLGIIEGAETKPGHISVNTGYGKVIADLHKTSGDLGIGDFVRVVAGRLDLNAIDDHDITVTIDSSMYF